MDNLFTADFLFINKGRPQIRLRIDEPLPIEMVNFGHLDTIDDPLSSGHMRSQEDETVDLGQMTWEILPGMCVRVRYSVEGKARTKIVERLENSLGRQMRKDGPSLWAQPGFIAELVGQTAPHGPVDLIVAARSLT